jgi:DNA primase
LRFSPSFLDDIRDRVPISDVIGRHVTWDRKKTNTSRGDWWACCPFHGEKIARAFHCEDRKGRYHCFGCGVSGDHFRFLTELEASVFPKPCNGSRTWRAWPCRSPIPRPRAANAKARQPRGRHGNGGRLLRNPAAGGRRAPRRAPICATAALSGRTIAAFRLGYAPGQPQRAQGASGGARRRQGPDRGLRPGGARSRYPGSYDRFRDRIMFPILSARERVIAFGGRALSPDAPAKYLNSNETELFHKGNVLYNFARARAPAARTARWWWSRATWM